MWLRMATRDDLPALVVLGREMHGSSTYASMDFDVDILKSTLTALMDKSQFVVVAEDTNREICGAMVGAIAPSWFGRDTVANDLALFVTRDARGSSAAVRLMKAFVQWALMAGARQIRPGVTTGDERAERLYERMGFARCGASFVMEGV